MTFPLLKTGEHLYLHYGSTGTWYLKIDEVTGELSLDGYELEDISIKRENITRSDFARNPAYVVTEKNGKKTYFADDGRLLAIEDRFGNNIRFFHRNRTIRDNDNMITTPVISRIVDSVGRNIFINYNDVNHTVSVTWGSNEVVYHKRPVVDIANPSTSKERARLNNEFVLEKVVDEMGRETRYDYDIKYAMDNYFMRNTAHYNSFDKDSSGNAILDTNGNPIYSKADNEEGSHKFIGVYNYYACLEKITYPTMAQTHYEYNKGVRYVVRDNDKWDDDVGTKIADRNIKSLGPDGSTYFYRVEKRYEKDKNGKIYNEKTYSYKRTKDNNVFCQYDGYPLYKAKDDIPNSFNVKTVVEDMNGNNFTYTYNKDLLCINILSNYVDGNYNEERLYRYDNNKQLMLSVKNVFNPSTGRFISYVENFMFDEYRNLKGYWGNGAKRGADSKTNYSQVTIGDYDPLDSEHKITYVYNPVYHYMTGMEYKKIIVHL
ncbi:UNVERIFIED_CONTAM: hypothetical protein Cloal_4326 [Acetivibrio alkalicellulosi]